MKKLVLSTLFTGDKLHVVDEQQVDTAVTVSKRCHLVFTDSVDGVVRKRFGSDVFDQKVRQPLGDSVTYGVHQVGFAQTGFAVDKKRVVGAPRRFGDG